MLIDIINETGMELIFAFLLGAACGYLIRHIIERRLHNVRK